MQKLVMKCDACGKEQMGTNPTEWAILRVPWHGFEVAVNAEGKRYDLCRGCVARLMGWTEDLKATG